MKTFVTLFLIFTGFCGFSQQVSKNLTASNGVFIGFYEYKPIDYSSAKKYPLIIFMHGVSERGNGTTELSRVLANAIPKYINRGNKMTFTWNGKTETFLVLSPQLSSAYGSWPAFYTEEMIRYAKQNLSIDTNRIIVTGLSLGGGGTWKFAIQNPTNPSSIAALAPICGTQQSGDFSNIAKANLPVWAFHAENDKTVSVNCTNNQVNAINNYSPSVNPIKTLWPTGGHVIWDKAYDTTYNIQNPNIFEWFLAQNKSLPVNQFPIANAGADLSGLLNENITLSAASSKDNDGHIVRYIWKQISGPVTSSITNAVSATGNATVSGLTVTGAYQFELKVIDDRAAIASDIVSVNITEGISETIPVVNAAPVAKAGNDANLTSSSYTLDGTASSDDKGIIKSSWTQLAGPATVSYTNRYALKTAMNGMSLAGQYRFRLRVWDAEGVIDVDDVTINVGSANGTSVSSTTTTDNTTFAAAETVIINPNPVNRLTANCYVSSATNGSIKIQILTIGGTLIQELNNLKKTTDYKTGLDVRNIPAGTYVVSVTINDTKKMSTQMVRQ